MLLLILFRFNEWGQAVWNLQKKLLDGRSTGPSWFFLGFVVDNPDVEARDLLGQKLIANMHGKIMGDPYFKCDFLSFKATEHLNFSFIDTRNGGITALKLVQKRGRQSFSKKHIPCWKPLHGPTVSLRALFFN